ncbi:hypothetical protein MVEN_01988400 [Mycena venus]|uniref:Uncharacterized protein n=1 Tax=Mycena venus TaxID=2733690 RepID=A0A8H7CKA4_9AGAR|nr:hypothetical protein MVEN_01988400 [Mycena venus]
MTDLPYSTDVTIAGRKVDERAIPPFHIGLFSNPFTIDFTTYSNQPVDRLLSHLARSVSDFRLVAFATQWRFVAWVANISTLVLYVLVQPIALTANELYMVLSTARALERLSIQDVDVHGRQNQPPAHVTAIAEGTTLVPVSEYDLFCPFWYGWCLGPHTFHAMIHDEVDIEILLELWGSAGFGSLSINGFVNSVAAIQDLHSVMRDVEVLDLAGYSPTFICAAVTSGRPP